MSVTDDLVAVRRLLDVYADVVCRRAWDELGELFVDDVDIEIAVGGREPMTFRGAAAFAAFVGSAVDQFDFFLLQVLNAHVDIAAPHRATSRMYMSELRQSDGDFSQVFGRYDDEFACIAGRWWFAKRRYRTLARTAEPGSRLDVFDA